MVKGKRGWSLYKRAMEAEFTGWWILGLAILVIVILGILILRGKGNSAIDYIKHLFAFGGS
jgi:hypothetical protein